LKITPPNLPIFKNGKWRGIKNGLFSRTENGEDVNISSKIRFFDFGGGEEGVVFHRADTI